jgi:hypothetical protein
VLRNGAGDALVRKAVLDEARKPWELLKARKGDALGYVNEVREWWMAYEYRVRSELELCPSTFSDKDDSATLSLGLVGTSRQSRKSL